MRAFPNFRSEGMELRDYFAAKAMQAIVSRSDFEFEDRVWETVYDIADAMMEARKVAAPENPREFTADETLRGRG